MIPSWISSSPSFERLEGDLPLEHTATYEDTVFGRATAIIAQTFGTAEVDLVATKRYFRTTLRLRAVGDVALLDRIE